MITALLDPSFGGPPAVARLHARAISGRVDLRIYGGAIPEQWSNAKSGFDVPVNLYPLVSPKQWFYCRGLRRGLLSTGSELDVLHAHMLWDHPVYVAAECARTNRQPLFLSPHGSLNADGRNRGVVKRIYRSTLLRRILRQVSGIHALNEQEALDCRNAGLTCPIHIIPNGLPRADFESVASNKEAIERWPILHGRKVLLYLGRLWSGKGLDILAQVWRELGSVVEFKDWLLVIAGPDYRGYSGILTQQMAPEIDRQRALITGPIYGSLKSSMLASAAAFVLPSYHEAFSMSVLEALAARLPVLITDKCNFPEVHDRRAGFIVSPEPSALSKGLRKLLSQTDQELAEMGQNGWKLGVEKYTLDSIGEMLCDMYKSQG